MQNSSPSVLLIDSGGGWSEDKKNTFTLFKKPILSFVTMDGISLVHSSERSFTTDQDPITIIENFISEGYIAVGYFSYEYSRFTVSGFTPTRKKEGAVYPELCFLFFENKDMISGNIEELNFKIDATENSSNIKLYEKSNVYSNLNKEEYLQIVNKARGYIRDGDIYQVNLSQRFTIKHDIVPIDYFLNLYEAQPVPFAAYIDFNDFKLLSGSMELFLKRRKNKIITRPIKGTAKRGESKSRDNKIKKELGKNPKERAENLMIVDLMRNDLSRVCKYGSVNVNELFNVKRYSTLFQMESEVEGDLRKGVTLKEIISGTFPPGSVTGAPKKRAIEIIDELEPHYRGPYCGSIGVFYPDGDFTMSVCIRVMVNYAENSIFWVGSGIVWDSNPINEYEETILKSEAINKTI